MLFHISYEERNKAGIYCITNDIDNRIYVGSTVNFWNRYYEHSNSLRKNKHYCRHLQNFVNKYGTETLHFRIIELIEERHDLLSTEQFYLDLCFSHGILIFNSARSATMFMIGKKISIEETKRKMREAWIKRKQRSL
jgi:group I intron endonuclease